MDDDDGEGSAAELRNRLMSDKACSRPASFQSHRSMIAGLTTTTTTRIAGGEGGQSVVTTKDYEQDKKAPPFFRLFVLAAYP